MKVIYQDTDATVLLTQLLHMDQDTVPIKGDRAKLPLYGVVTVIDRLYDAIAGEYTLTCERYDDGDGEDEA